MDKNEVLKILEMAKDKNGEVPMRLVRQAFEKLPESCEDAISRQAAIDILDAYQVMIENGEKPYAWARLRMSELPSEQLELIQCKDCKHRGEKPIADGRYWCELHDSFMYYCSDAERRTDGSD